MLNKISLTQQILDQLKWDIKPTLDQAMQEWWKNPDEHAGLRLTAEGFFVFSRLEIAHYEFDVPASMPAKPGQLLTLEKLREDQSKVDEVVKVELTGGTF